MSDKDQAEAGRRKDDVKEEVRRRRKSASQTPEIEVGQGHQLRQGPAHGRATSWFHIVPTAHAVARLLSLSSSIVVSYIGGK